MSDDSKKDGDRVPGDERRESARYGARPSEPEFRAGERRRSSGPDTGDGTRDRRGTPRSAREDRPRSVGQHPRWGTTRDHQPTRPGASGRDDRRSPRESGGVTRGGRTEARREDRPWREDRERRGASRQREDRRPRDGQRQERGRPDGGRGGGERRGGPREARQGRPGQSAREQRPFEPVIPEGITGRELERDLREELRGLSRDTAERVSQHMVAAHLLQDTDPRTAQDHARFAARLGGRVGAVRETYGIVAYRAGDYRTAVRELRTSLRITGRTDVLPMIADAERGLGRPERALDIAGSDEASDLGADAAIELIIVVAGAYADTGDVETALRTLEIPALRHKVDGRWQVRLWVAYADLLARAERQEEATSWLTLAADADTEGLTDAAARLGRPVPEPVDEPWGNDEAISVLDAYDETADAGPGTDAGVLAGAPAASPEEGR